MELVSFASPLGGGETLRPTHAVLVAQEMDLGPDASGTIDAADLAAAVERVRGRYRCRTVRKELRRVRLLAEDARGEGARITVSCRDQSTTVLLERSWIQTRSDGSETH